MKTKVKVNCSECTKEYEIDKGHLSIIRKRNSKNYCSNECKNGTLEERFWSKVDIGKKEDCWLWRGNFRSNGYGQIRLKGKTLSAHRVSYELMFGAINDIKMFVCHKCDNPICVNPNHFFLGTNSDNMKDAYKKGRINPIPPVGNKFKKGDKAKNSVLTDEQVLQIREMINNGDSVKDISLLFLVSRYKITDIKRGRSYINVH